MSQTHRTMLRALADCAGILREYVDYQGVRRETADATREALLAALGFDASTEEAAGGALDDLETTRTGRILEPTAVLTLAQSPPRIRVRVPPTLGRQVEFSLVLRREDGDEQVQQGPIEVDGRSAETDLQLRDVVPIGYHDLSLTLTDGGGEVKAHQRLIVAPTSCTTPRMKFGDRRLFGIWTNLYSVRGEVDWGVGDFGSLRELVDWSATVGAAFVGLNPLHALRNRGADVSPYRPISRLFRSVLYLDIAAVPEIADCDEAKSLLSSTSFQHELQRLRDDGRVNYDEVLAKKSAVLEQLHRVFVKRHGDTSTDRGRAYRDFVDREGDALRDFATFSALDEHFRRENSPGDWRSWPQDYRDPRSPAVAEFRERHRRRVDYRAYLQFELDRQMGELAVRARQRGMPIGLFQDLALSTAPDGCDPWAYPHLFVEGASLGAPPDELGPQGQNWSLPPLHPRRLKESGYAFWRDLLRRSFASAGALRIDHVMGLLRQFWIPKAFDGTNGAYVAFPAEDLFAILALESRRAGAIVIGEDLGTVPWGFEQLLERWGVLSTRVLYFERDEKGEFRPPAAYPSRALATVATHDLAPLAGFWRDRDLTLRRKVGQIESDDELETAKRRRELDRQALLRRFQSENLAAPNGIGNAHEVVAAAHALLSRSPATLVGVSLDDLALETDPVNLPGIDQEGYPNWSRRMSMKLSGLRSSTQVGTMLSPMTERTMSSSGNRLD